MPRRSKRLNQLAEDSASRTEQPSTPVDCVRASSVANITVAWQQIRRHDPQEDQPDRASEDLGDEPFARRSHDGSRSLDAASADYQESAGLWSLIPDELLEIILRKCTAIQLAQLASTCRFFQGSKLIDRIVKHRLKQVPRAKGLKPKTGEKESYVMLLHYVNCQSAAAAQATSIACGSHHTAALLITAPADEDQPQPHSLYTFGRGFHGQLGNGEHTSSKTPVRVSLGFKPSQESTTLEEETMPAVVSCGAHHTTAISRKGDLYSWGLGAHGELGLGRWGPLEVPLPRQSSNAAVRIVSVACGTSHTLAIAENGTLWSCGVKTYGQLGNGTAVNGARLNMLHDLTSYRIVSSAAGAAHSLALASDGSLFTWGSGHRGQLGHGTAKEMDAAGVATVNERQCVLAPKKISRLDPSHLAAENRVTAVAAGANHSIALTVGGKLMVFGANEHGQLGIGDATDQWRPSRLELSPRSGGQPRCLRAVQIACGQNHTIALFSVEGRLQVRTTGLNTHGQLGLGDRQSRATFTLVARLVRPVAVQAGDEHSAAVTRDGELYLWGRGDSGQLGVGDVRGRCRPTLLPGFAVVHPDKTLRRNKRMQPITRVAARDAANMGAAGAPCM